jgi:hypothetical protein
MCARVAIDLKLFGIIAESNGPIALAELAIKTGVEEQLLGKDPSHDSKASLLTFPQSASFAESHLRVW